MTFQQYLLIFFDIDNRFENQSESIRLISRLKKGISNNDLNKILNLIAEHFVKEIKKDKEKNIANSLGEITGKIVINAAFLDNMASIFAKKFVGKMVVSLLISTVYSIGGVRSRAIYGSRQLKEFNFGIYNQLKKWVMWTYSISWWTDMRGHL